MAASADGAKKAMNESVAESGEDYTRFHVPPVWGVDPSVIHEAGEHTDEGVCKLAHFLYRGESPWPFKYSIPAGEIK